MSTSDMVLFTQQGYDALKKELEHLKNVERPKVIEEIAEARAHGDLKENAEYHAAREKQSFIEGRITMLDDSIARANVVSFADESPDLVKFGAMVTVEDEETGEAKTFQIVGDLEANIEVNKISLGSPLAKALIGNRVDDLVQVKAPKGHREYVITKIEYR